MPIMTRMRDSMPVILFGLLIAFLITIVFEWGMDYLGIRGGASDVVGMVNGKKISYREFSELVKNMSDNAKAQSGQEPDEATTRQLRDQAWQSLLTERLIADEVKRLGITVSDQELRDWVFGENPPAELKRNFTDSTGQFNREMYERVLTNPNQYIQDPRGADPNYGSKRLQEFERVLRQQRIQEKLQSIVMASVRVSDGELRQRFADQTQRYDALYAIFDPSVLVKDSDVQVSDADLREYYEENIDQYKFEATRKLKYTLFLESSSAADSAARLKEVEDAVAKARSGIDFLQLVYTYSERPDSAVTFRRGELSPSLENAVFGAKVGEVVGPISDADGFHIVKVLQEKKSDKVAIHAAHILLQLGGADSNQVKAQAQEILRSIRAGKDFAALAREFSRDPSSAQNGGDLGWFSKGRMVAPFESAAFAAKTGEVVGPVRTQFGLHIIKVLGRDDRELSLAHILMKITPSSQTKNDIADRAKDFAYNARETEFTHEAQQTGLDVRETQIQDKSGVIPGIGINEAITRWAFNAKVGAVSDPFEVTNGSAVFAVAEAKEAGVKPFDEVKESLKPLVLRKRKMDRAKQLATEARSTLLPGDSLTKLAKGNPSIPVQSTGPFTLTGSIPLIGRDQVFMGAVSALHPGEVSPAVAGTRGVYLIALVTKADFDSSAFALQKEMLRGRALQEKRNRFLSDWIARLKEKADIEDKRDIFFR